MKLSLNAVYQSFASHPDGTWILKPEPAKALYQFMRKTKAKNILELGTGIGLSTTIMALCLEEKKTPYTITTLEQYDRISKVAQTLIPKNLQKNIKFHVIEAVPWLTPEIPCQFYSTFKEIPEGDYDLIIVDGPGPLMIDGKFVEIPNGDVFKLHQEGRIKPGTVIYYDGRLESLNTLERYYGENFYILDEPQKKINVIERKDNPVKFFDYRKLQMEKLGYKA